MEWSKLPGAVAVPASRRGRARSRMAEEDRLIEAGLLPDIDFCRKALALSANGRVPDAKHLSTCAVCLRRWRVTEAELLGWQAMGHAVAVDVMREMATAFPSAERDDRYRAFYAHVAVCGDCERRLAELTFESPLAVPVSSRKV
jgi:hypothetical protein